MRNAEKITLIIVIISFILGVALYQSMPDLMASHWNIHGQVDDYLPKFWGLFLMPFISAVMLVLFIFIPKIDPLKHNINKFRKYFDGFMILIILFLLSLYIVTILWSSGITFNMIYFIVPAIAIIFYYTGVLIENAKRNWFIGIRTPWTLSSERVWNKTHKLGGKLFKILSAIILIGVLLTDYAFLIMLIPILGITIYLIAYSYVEYSRKK